MRGKAGGYLSTTNSTMDPSDTLHSMEQVMAWCIEPSEPALSHKKGNDANVRKVFQS